MTQRERPAAAGVSELVRRSPAEQPVPPRPGAAAATQPLWDALFQNASAVQQQEWLALANRQGILYYHQLPATGNGTPAPADPARRVLAQVLAGNTRELDPVPADAVAVRDTALDATQRAAVAKALHTPDFFLLQGLPGTGKSRVLAEIVTQAAARGERVLLLGPTAAAIDSLLERLVPCDEVCALRCLGREERPETLPPRLRAVTLAERVHRLREVCLVSARRDGETAARLSRRLGEDEAAFGRLHQLAESERQRQYQAEVLRQRRDRLQQQVEAEAAGPSADAAAGFALAVQQGRNAWEETRTRLEAALADRRRDADQKRQDLAALAEQLAPLAPLAAAKRAGRWWTWKWWQATFRGGLLAQVEQLEARQQQAQAALADAEQQVERLVQECHEAGQAYQAEQGRLIAAEVARRRQGIEAEEETLAAQQHALQAEWEKVCRGLCAESPRPAALDVAAVQAAHAAWRRHGQHAEETRAFNRQWVAWLEQGADALAEQLLSYVSVVAATTAALAADGVFRGASARGAPFDLLILEDAEEVTESEFLTLAGRARRWVLVGQPAPEDDGPAQRDGAEALRKPTLHAQGLRPGFFHRLWQALHCDLRRLPSTWVCENDRLCWRRRVVTPEQRPCVESERVADFPEIELRILALPRAEPQLVEVVFPPSMSIAQAKEYIYRELEELPMQASAAGLCWVEESDRLVLHFAESATANALPVTLESGVRELVCAGASPGGTRSTSACWDTCRLEFDRKTGWQRRKAEEWVERHLGLRDAGRTARLLVPYRMQPGLAALVSDLLVGVAYRIPTGLPSAGPAAAGAAHAVEFVPVPPLATPRRTGDARSPAPRNGDQQRGRAPLARGGAGLELDLADPRHRDRLPSELRPGLPSQGLVNYLEAVTVVKAVEALVGDAAVRAELGRREPGASPPTLAVIALYAAQADLIRCLLAQTPTVAAAGVAVEVGAPSAFRHRECEIALVSLTRSHTHRAVAFGDAPEQFALALTRARRRLILFGDPGTLARRSQWQGPLDHLGEIAAARERAVVGRLVDYLHGPGPQPPSFHVRTSSGP
jgi:hypothetical protein